MKTNAMELRNLVVENSLELGRLTEKQLGKEDYKELTVLYRSALDAMTNLASANYNHTTTQKHLDDAFNSVKAILGLYETDDDRIVIDKDSMNSIRDMAIKPQRMYSDKYKKAEKARSNQQKTAIERYTDLLTMGVEKPTEYDVVELIKGIKNKCEVPTDIALFVETVKTSGVNVSVGTTSMLEMFENALATLVVKTKAVNDVKAAGKWTWRRPAPVDGNGEPKVFADLIENYIADCLVDGYNIKPTNVIRAENKAERDAKKANKTK